MMTLKARLQRLEAAARAMPHFDCLVEYGLSESRFEQAVRAYTQAVNHSIMRVEERGKHFKRITFDPAPYEPEPPEDFTESEREAFCKLVPILRDLNAMV